MKRKIGIIIAVLLCVVLVCTFFACKKKDKTPQLNPSEQTQTDTFSSIEDYIENWLYVNAKEEPSNQKKSLGNAIKEQLGEFSFLDKNDNPVKPAYVVEYTSGTEKGKYTITFTWTGSDKSTVKKVFEIDEEVVKYNNWAGKNSKLSDAWSLGDDGSASSIVDEILVGAINTVNEVTGNAITGKFGADGVIGISIAGKNYGLRIKGNVDGTTKANNEIGLVLMDGDKELGGVYYKAAESAKDSKLYIQYATDDGYAYKYIDYADIFGFIQGFLPTTFPEANDGVLQFKNANDKVVEVEGLADLLDLAGVNATMVGPIIDMLATPYKNGDRYYVDINLAAISSTVVDIVKDLGLELDFLKDLNIELEHLSGIRGHITLSGKVVDEKLTDFELAVNIPAGTWYLNGERITNETPNANEFKLNWPEVCFAIYIEDFKFLTDDAVENVVPAKAISDAVYFSPTNIDFSGDVYINHYELNDQNEQTKQLDSTFHFEVVTDINVLEIIENGRASTAKAALVIKQSRGATYDEDTATNFLSLSYEQATKTLCASGTAFDLNDNGEQVYIFQITSLADAANAIKLWLGLEANNWHGVSGSYELLDYVLTSDTVFKANETYYTKNANNEYVEATVVVGEAVTENTYYVVPDTYESAKTVFGNSFIRSLILMFIGNSSSNNGGNNGGNSSAEGEVAAAMDVDLGATLDAFKGIYNEFVEAGKIVIEAENGNFAAKVEVTKDMINRVVGVINDTFNADIDPLTDPEFVNIYINYGETYKDKISVSVKFKGNTYELLLDKSVANKYVADFKFTRASKRSYEFKLTAQEGTVTTVDVIFDVVKDSSAETPVIENHTAVGLSNFSITWGDDNSDKVGDLIPDKTGALPIFPAEDVPSVGTQLAKGIAKIISNSKVQKIIMMGIGLFMSK